MKNEKALKIIREKCVEANPELSNKRGKFCNECGEEIGYDSDSKIYFCPRCPYLSSDKTDQKQIKRPIQLADVLLVLDGKWLDIVDTIRDWNLRETLENQTEGTLEFIANLLSK